MYSETKILKINEENIISASELLKSNKLVGIPTETVYGLGGRADNDVAIKKIFKIKNRPLSNPLILHYKSSDHALNDIFCDDRAKELAKKFWPGALTIVCKIKNKYISKFATANLDTVAVRVPSNNSIKKLLNHLEFPLAAPSANRYGKISPTSASDVYEELKNKIPLILDGGECSVGLESTIVEITEKKICILRHGFIPTSEIEKTLDCKIENLINAKIYRSPGLAVNHYQPDKPVRINASKRKINEGWLAFGKIPDKSVNPSLSLSKKKCLKEAAKNLYK
ncbi:L-threonylcarbamoyladenylate synthase, partial [Alphaproteobacteria bacterium]|nr:L-threonylcarbamoyladenylate synthase [Alphaproteobacteria bacterium]